MRDFSLITLPGDLKSDLGAHPLAAVLGEAEIVVQDQPDNPLIGTNFDQSDLAAMEVFEVICELIVEFGGYRLRSPPTTIRGGW